MRQRYRFRWFRLLLLCVMGYFIYILAGQQVQLNSINREKEAAIERLEQLRQAGAGLEEERGQLLQPSYIEKIAREELGLVKPGEVPFVPAKKN